MTGQDGWLRAGTALAVLLVATIAAVISFVHIRELAVTHGQTVLAAVLLPLSIDGTVAAASLVMLRAARASLPTPGLARFMLALAVIATLAANIGYGLPFGVAGALLSGWPAAAFIGCAEMAILMVRKTARAAPDGMVPSPVFTDAQSAAVAALARTVAAGNPLSNNSLMAQFRLTRREAAEVREAVTVTGNGHGGNHD